MKVKHESRKQPTDYIDKMVIKTELGCFEISLFTAMIYSTF